jgi:hypothetical protein
MDYLDLYPLYSSNYLDYLEWKHLSIIALTRLTYTKELIDQIINTKHKIYIFRTKFNWDHLNNLS